MKDRTLQVPTKKQFKHKQNTHLQMCVQYHEKRDHVIKISEEGKVKKNPGGKEVL